MTKRYVFYWYNPFACIWVEFGFDTEEEVNEFMEKYKGETFSNVVKMW